MDLWLIERDGATEQELMHGEVREAGLRSLLDVLDSTEGLWRSNGRSPR
jgi:hypothetical protein